MRLRHRLGQAVLHQEAVRQAGQDVVVREVLHPLLGPLALGHVARSQHDAADPGMLQQVVAEDLQVDPGAVCMPEPHHRGQRQGLVAQDRRERVARAGDILWMNCFERCLADQRSGRIAKHTGSGRGFVDGQAAFIVDGDDVERILHQRTEAGLAFLHGVALAAIAWRAFERTRARRHAAPAPMEEANARLARRPHEPTAATGELSVPGRPSI